MQALDSLRSYSFVRNLPDSLPCPKATFRDWHKFKLAGTRESLDNLREAFNGSIISGQGL